MAAVMKQCQRGSEDRGRAKKRKHFRIRNKPKCLRLCMTSLLFVLPGAASVAVEGLKGGNITLLCPSSSREDLTTVLTFGHTTAFGADQDKYFRGRVIKSGSCDLILKDLKSTDAGKYTSKVFANGQQPDSYIYDVGVKVNLTGRKGEELMFDDLPREAESAERFTDPDWTEVWRRGRGVLTDRLTNKNGRLSIKNFTSSDAGIYRVLNSTGGILLTVTVTESGSESKDKLDSTHDELDGTEKNYTVIVVLVVVVVIAFVFVFAVIIKRRCQNRSNEHDSYQGVSTQETVQGPRSLNNSKGCLVGLQQICRGSCQHIIPD